MPVGTRGAVKAVTQRDLEDLGAEIILGNTYHLYLRPGDELIARAGGLHAFIGWDRADPDRQRRLPGVQPRGDARIREEGAEFRSHLDGSCICSRRRRATDIQAQLGSDIAMVLDECVAHRRRCRRGARRRWSGRCGGRGAARDAASRSCAPIRRRPTSSSPTPARRSSASSRAGLPGPARPRASQATVDDRLRGLRDRRAERRRAAPRSCTTSSAHTAPQLPADRPRYLMGTGMPDDLIESVARGIDMFDCVLPTRNARNGQLLTREGRSSSRMRGTPRTRRRRIRSAAATPAGTFHGPICVTYTWPAR